MRRRFTKKTTEKKSTSKYKNIRKEVDGIKFDSILEANCYIAIKESGLTPELQVPFEIQPKFRDDEADKGIRAINYRADFVITRNGTTYIGDAKGQILPEFALKRKLLLYKGIRVICIRSKTKAYEFSELIKQGLPPHKVQKIVEHKPKRKKKTPKVSKLKKEN